MAGTSGRTWGASGRRRRSRSSESTHRRIESASLAATRRRPQPARPARRQIYKLEVPARRQLNRQCPPTGGAIQDDEDHPQVAQATVRLEVLACRRRHGQPPEVAKGHDPRPLPAGRHQSWRRRRGQRPAPEPAKGCGHKWDGDGVVQSTGSTKGDGAIGEQSGGSRRWGEGS